MMIGKLERWAWRALSEGADVRGKK